MRAILLNMTEGASQYPPEPATSRYGRQRQPARVRRRMAFALGAVAVVIAVIVAIVAYQRFSAVDVQGRIDAYQVLDDHSVSVTISVTRKDPARPVSCIVRARSRDGDETGRREILVPPADSATVQVTTIVESYKRPFVGDIYGCGTDVPWYLVRPPA